MTLLSLYPSTHVPLFLCVSASKSSPLVPPWLPGVMEVASRAQNHAYLTRPLDVIYVHWSIRPPQLALAVLTKRSMTLTFGIQHVSFLTCHAQQVHQQVSAFSPDSIKTSALIDTHMHDQPPRNPKKITHIQPRSFRSYTQSH